MGSREGMHHVFGNFDPELLLPRDLWVNFNIAFSGQIFSECLMPFNSNVRSLSEKSLLLTN